MRELLNNPYPFAFYNNGWVAKFSTEKGIVYKVVFSDNSKNQFVPFEKYRDAVEVYFAALDERGVPFYRVLNTGDAPRIFSTVVNVIKDFFKEEHPSVKHLSFSAAEPSRIKLYKIMIDVLCRGVGIIWLILLRIMMERYFSYLSENKQGNKR